METTSPRTRKHNRVIKEIAEDLTPEEIYQARLIVARQKFWTPDIEKLLRRWRRQVNLLHAEHKLAEYKYNRRYYLLGVPATIASTVVASGILSTFKNCNECVTGCTPASTDSCANDEWIRLAMGLIGVISIVLTCLSVFLNYGQASSDNKGTADDYGTLTRELDAVLESPVSTRGDPISFLQGIRTRFDDISKQSPLSTNISLEYKTIKEEKRKMSNVGPPSPEQVYINGKRRKIPDASSLAKILVDKIEADGQAKASVRRKVIEENDYDSDEENEREVAITFDFDELRPEDLLENEKKNTIQASLARALEFELTRMYPRATESDPILEIAEGQSEMQVLRAERTEDIPMVTPSHEIIPEVIQNEDQNQKSIRSPKKKKRAKGKSSSRRETLGKEEVN